MACFARVLFFAVPLAIVLANSTIPDHNHIATTLTPNKEASRVRPMRPFNVGNKRKPVADTYANNTNFQKEFEKMIPETKLTRDVNSVAEFWKKRNALADSEVDKLLGNRMPLSERELEANQIVLSKKFEEFDKSLDANATFPPSITFFESKDLIEASDIFKIIQRVPKGGILCDMFIAGVPLSFMYDLTLEDNLYIQLEDTLQFKFSLTVPGPNWQLLSALRDTDNSDNLEDLNTEIRNRLNIIPHPEYPEATPTLREMLQVYSNLTSYRPILEKTFNKALEVLYEDNVMYADFYYHFPDVYNLAGRIYTPLEVFNIFKTLLARFLSTHKDFIGVRFICAPIERLTIENFSRLRRITTLLWKTNPELIAGFGVPIIDEDEEPYSYWAEEFLKFPKEIKIFLDAGVTLNWGTNADYTLLDALALNTAAIGAGISLNKHPLVLETLRERNIPVKSNPVLSQIYTFASDVRTHPLTLLLATDFPLVIINAAGTAWNSTGLSYDWYEVFVAMTPRFCDLRCLKQLAVNSLLHSNLSKEEKKKGIKVWQRKWDEFIDFVIENYNSKL